jgi:hypothetical protein
LLRWALRTPSDLRDGSHGSRSAAVGFVDSPIVPRNSSTTAGICRVCFAGHAPAALDDCDRFRCVRSPRSAAGPEALRYFFFFAVFFAVF